MNATIRWVGWSVSSLLALLMVLLASRYLTFDPNVYFPQQRAVYVAHTLGISSHVGGGMLALLLGPWQFVSAVRERWPRIHRITGRFYLAGITVGALGGLYMAPLAFGGLPSRLGFTLLALAWLATSAMAYRLIRRGEVDRHRRWMIRSFALTFAAPALRVELIALTALGLSFTSAYIAVAWACWVPNLLAAELYLRRTGPGRRVAGGISAR